MVSPLIPDFLLNNGSKIPSVGMGCWMGGPGGGQRVTTMVEKALNAGYRHFDTAAGYENEKMVGDAIRAFNIPRSEIYITTKLANGDHHRVREAFEESLEKLDCEYIDLYLMHWPQGTTTAENDPSLRRTLSPEETPTFVDTWKEMEKLLETGKVKTLGVSNFSIQNLSKLLPHCTIIPATNQVEVHPCLPSHELKAFCESKSILLTAYSPLGRSKTFFEDNTIKAIADRQNVTPAQLLVSWGVQRGTIVIPKSEDEGRMKENLTLFKVPDDDMQTLDNFHKQPGMHRSLLKYHSPTMMVFGWTYAQMGWNMIQGGIIPP